MIYPIFKEIGKNIPNKIDNVYYSIRRKRFYSLSCNFILDGDNYKIEGPDEILKEKLQKRIENKIPFGIPVAGSYIDESGGIVYWDGEELTPFDHPEFQNGLMETVLHWGYTVNPKNIDFQFVKVHNKQEAEDLMFGQKAA